MVEHLTNINAAGPAFTSMVVYIVLMAMLLGNSVRLSRRRACRIRVRPRGTWKPW